MSRSAVSPGEVPLPPSLTANSDFNHNTWEMYAPPTLTAPGAGVGAGPGPDQPAWQPYGSGAYMRALLNDRTMSFDHRNNTTLTLRRMCRDIIFTRLLFISLFLGQALAILISAGNTFASLHLLDRGVYLPFTYRLILCTLLSIISLPYLLYTRSWSRLLDSFYACRKRLILMVFLEGSARSFLLLGYSESPNLAPSFWSTWSVVTAVGMALLFLGIRYRFGHLLALMVVLTSILAHLLLGASSPYEFRGTVHGDVLLLASASFYGIAYVLQEDLLSPDPYGGQLHILDLTAAIGTLGFSVAGVSWGLFGGAERAILVRMLAGKTLPPPLWCPLLYLAFALATFFFTLYLISVAGATYTAIAILPALLYDRLFAWLLDFPPGPSDLPALFLITAVASVVGIILFGFQKAQRSISRDIDLERAAMLAAGGLALYKNMGGHYHEEGFPWIKFSKGPDTLYSVLDRISRKRPKRGMDLT